MKIIKYLRTIFFFIFIGAMLAGLLGYAIFGDRIPFRELQASIRSSTWAPALFIFLYTILSVFIPTTPMMAVGGIFFGFWNGLVYTTIAGFLSSTFTFFVARLLGKEAIENYIEHKKSLDILERYDEKISKHGITSVIVLRMLPVMPFNVLNLLMGVSKVKFRDYALGTLVGLAPSNSLAIYFSTFVLTEEFREISFFLSILLALVVAGWFVFRLSIVRRYFRS